MRRAAGLLWVLLAACSPSIPDEGPIDGGGADVPHGDGGSGDASAPIDDVAGDLLADSGGVEPPDVREASVLDAAGEQGQVTDGARDATRAPDATSDRCSSVRARVDPWASVAASYDDASSDVG